jgi:hypothetical protein
MPGPWFGLSSGTWKREHIITLCSKNRTSVLTSFSPPRPLDIIAMVQTFCSKQMMSDGVLNPNNDIQSTKTTWCHCYDTNILHMLSKWCQMVHSTLMMSFSPLRPLDVIAMVQTICSKQMMSDGALNPNDIMPKLKPERCHMGHWFLKLCHGVQMILIALNKIKPLPTIFRPYSPNVTCYGK